MRAASGPCARPCGTMAWQPQEQPLGQLAGFLKDSLSRHNPAAQKQATLVGLVPPPPPPPQQNLTVWLSAS